MNENHEGDLNIAKVVPKPWEEVLEEASSPEVVDLLSKLLVFEPNKRLPPLEICAHPFFDELRDENTRLPNKR